MNPIRPQMSPMFAAIPQTRVVQSPVINQSAQEVPVPQFGGKALKTRIAPVALAVLAMLGLGACGDSKPVTPQAPQAPQTPQDSVTQVHQSPDSSDSSDDGILISPKGGILIDMGGNMGLNPATGGIEFGF